MDYTLYKFLAPLIAGLNILSISLSLRYLKGKISQFVLRFQLSALLLLLLEYIEFYSTNQSVMVCVIRFGHIAMQLYAVSWFLFCLNFTGYEKSITKKFIIGIFSIIIINTIMIFTDNFHHLFYQSVSLNYKSGHSTVMAVYGFYFWLVCAFDYIFIIAGVCFVVVSYIRGGSYYRSQAQFIVFGYILTLIVNIIYIFRLIPGFSKDYSAVTFSMISLFTFIGTYRFRILHYAPLSRNLVLQNIHDALITLDSDYIIIDYNIKANELFGLTEKDLGTQVERGFLGSTIGNVSTFFSNKDHVSFIKKIKDNSYNLNIRRLYDKNSTSRGIVLTFTDITDKINLLNELNISSKKIDSMESHLIKSEKMAALGQLSAEISHEINNPLTYIKSNFSVLQRYIIDGTFIDRIDDIKEIVGDTCNGIDRINEVVKNMLSYSKDYRGSRETVYDLNKGVESTLILARSVIRHRAELKLDLGHNIPEMEISGKRIDQVILNLLVNSAHAIEEDRIDSTITIKTYVKNEKIICDISDNGKPIKSEDRELIFEPFYTTKNEGTGVGLSLSRKIIETEFHGRLYLTKSKDKTFRIELPM